MSSPYPHDLFTTAHKMLSKAPLYTNVSVAINFRPSPKGYDGMEKLVCHYLIDSTAERNMPNVDDSSSTEEMIIRKKSELTVLQSQDSSTDGSFAEDLEESNPLIDERGPSARTAASVSSSASRGLRTSVVFPRATLNRHSASKSRSDASILPKPSKKKGTPIIVTLPSLQTKKSPEKAVKDILMKELAATIKKKARDQMTHSAVIRQLNCRKSEGGEVDLTAEGFAGEECQGN